MLLQLVSGFHEHHWNKLTSRLYVKQDSRKKAIFTMYIKRAYKSDFL